MTISIDDMAKAGCTTPRGIRYWESEGLLGKVERTAGNQRRYTQTQLDAAKVIAAAQFGGFDLETAKAMVLGYDSEVYEAILHRLMLQQSAAAKLADDLPAPPAKPEALEWDL